MYSIPRHGSHRKTNMQGVCYQISAKMRNASEDTLNCQNGPNGQSHDSIINI